MAKPLSAVLTDRQKLFVDEYMVDLNATQAAIRAGYSKASAGDLGRQSLRNPRVAAAIAERQKVISEKLGITAEHVIEELAKIGFANMLDYTRVSEGPYSDGLVIDFSALDRHQAAAIAEVTVEEYQEGRGAGAREVKRTKFKLHDKRAALVDLGKHLGLFKEKVELSGPGGGPIQVEESPRARIASRIAKLAAAKG